MKHGGLNRIPWRFVPAVLLMLGAQSAFAQEKCIQSGADQQKGTQNGYYWELWNQNSQGTACMTLGAGSSFSGRWSGILNYLARRGLKYDETQTHKQIGTINVKYSCDYKPSNSGGNSYLSIYGWTVDPLVEYYIIEDWRNWIPSKDGSAQNKGSLDIDGSQYDIVQTTRTQQPSIKGTATFPQFFSIRKTTRNSGSIQVSKHFEKWESLGMKMGKMYEVSFVVEGYNSSGSFDFKELTMTAGAVGVNIPVAISHKVKVFPLADSKGLGVNLAPSLQNPTIQVYDMAGTLEASQADKYSARFEKLNPGLHVVKVQSLGEVFTSKVLVR